MALLVVKVVAATLLMALVSASDPGPINDFCMADLKSPLLFNGLACKSPMEVTSEDFAFREFRAAAATNNSLGIGITPGFARVNYGALNTQGFALAKINYAKSGLVPPHTHPRASEVIMVSRGEVYVGFVDTMGKLFATIEVEAGRLLCVPARPGALPTQHGQWLIHDSVGAERVVQLLPSALFGSSPTMDTKMLAKVFSISHNLTDWIKRGFMPPSM